MTQENRRQNLEFSIIDGGLFFFFSSLRTIFQQQKKKKVVRLYAFAPELKTRERESRQEQQQRHIPFHMSDAYRLHILGLVDSFSADLLCRGPLV